MEGAGTMNNARPDWYMKAKSAFLEKEGFSDEMTRAVILRIEKKRQLKRSTPFKLSIAVLASITVCSLFILLYNSNSSFFSFSTDRLQGWGAGEDWNLDYQYSVKSPAELPGHKGYSTVLPVQLERKNKASVIIKEEVAFEEVGKFLSYVRSEDEGKHLYFGFELAGDNSSEENYFYEIGPGYLSNVMFMTSRAFGQSDLRLSGGAGPDLECTFWIAIKDGIPVINYMLDAGAYEADLDGDGVAEVIAETSSILDNKIYIYKKIGDRIEWVDVSAAVKAESQDTISYDSDSQQFWIHFSSGSRGYQYASGEDKLERVSN